MQGDGEGLGKGDLVDRDAVIDVMALPVFSNEALPEGPDPAHNTHTLCGAGSGESPLVADAEFRRARAGRLDRACDLVAEESSAPAPAQSRNRRG